jgi:hypothetical protein
MKASTADPRPIQASELLDLRGASGKPMKESAL